MGKNPQELIKWKIKNPVYSEILLRINSRSIHAYALAKEMEKARPVLVVQLQRLHKEGFLERKSIKKGKRTLVLFTVSWPGICREFWRYCQSIKPGIKIKKEFKTNKYLALYFQKLFEKYYAKKKLITIESIFTNTIHSGLESMTIPAKSKDTKDFHELAKLITEFQFTDNSFHSLFLETIREINNEIHKILRR